VNRPVPRHVAIVMDGNGRWARKRLMPRNFGHRKGVETLRSIVKASAARRIDYLTVFAFSTENWSRPQEEVGALMSLFVETLEKEVPALMENKVRIRFIGDRSALGRKVIEKMRMSETQTEKNKGLTLTIALNYSGRDDLVRAFGRIVEDTVPAQHIDETLISSYLDTAGIPDPDLIIRTGGEHRISNFFLWQSAYSEFYTSSRYWPDFNEKEFDKALNAYGKRERRFGGLG